MTHTYVRWSGLRQLLAELWVFGLKQAWACVFGAALLALILATQWWYPSGGLARYDFLFLAALVLQALLLATRLETIGEARLIFVFHAIATAMEVFKTSPEIRSWIYPDASLFRIGNVPLLAGFMYSAVGSYIARAWKVLRLRFEHYPPPVATYVLAGAIYANFYTHHFVADVRAGLFIAAAVLFRRTRVYFTLIRRERHMPLLAGLLLVSLFIWMAENLSTWARIWVYPDQLHQWRLVSPHKLGAWFLLMLISFVLVSWLHRRELLACRSGPLAAMSNKSWPEGRSYKRIRASELHRIAGALRSAR